MSTRTRWHAEVDLPSSERDPFAGAGPVEQVGLPIDLREGEATLQQRIVDLLESENALFNRGTVCGLKNMPDSTCSACPESHHAEAGHKLATLCRIGRQTEETVMELHIAKARTDAQGQGT